MQNRQWIRGVLAALLAALVVPGLIVPGPALAQSNLLQNPGFDGAYTGRAGISGGVPDGWNAWGSFQNSDHESLSVLVHSAPYSWRLRTESGLPTGGGYQTVTAQNGATYRFSIYALIWTCNDEQYQCRDSTHTFADTSSGGRLRIGIDPTGGSDPYSGSVRWSGFASPFNWGTLTSLSVEATAQAGQVTVFTYYTADVAMRWHDVFWDDASLVAVSGPAPANTSAPLPTAAPVVPNAQTRADGSQVHVVQAGQTLWAISLAYGVPLDTLRALNNLSGSTIYVGQEIIVCAATVTATPAVVYVTATPPPTPLPAVTQVALGAYPTPLPLATQAAVQVGGDQPSGGKGNNSTRIVVLVAAAVIVLGAVAATGGLAGYLAFKIFRT